MDDAAPDLPPFIATQRLFHLTAPRRDRLKWLEPPWFHLRRRFEVPEKEEDDEREEEDRDGQSPQQSPTAPALTWEDPDLAAQLGSPESAWDEVVDRARFLIDPSRRLLCVVDDAGLGKTKTLEQIGYLRGVAERRGHLAILVEFADLPLQVAGYMGRTPTSTTVGGGQPLLIARLCADQTTFQMTPDQAGELLHRKARQGLLTVLVDALDQTNVGRDGWEPRQAAQILADFLAVFPEVRCVVSGRPFAVEFYRDTLFTRNDWHFAQLDRFTPEEETDFLGAERVAAIEQLEFRSGAVPRDLETIRELSPDVLRQVRTQADLYTRCVQRMLQKAREKQPIELTQGRVHKLLALLAFETVRQGKTAGIGAGLTDPALDNETVEDFVRGLWQRRQKSLRRDGYESFEDLNEDLGRLAALNIALDPGVLAIPHRHDPRAPQLTWLKFRNRTLQDYFAALWLAKYSSSTAERAWLRTHRHVRGRWGEHHLHAGLYEFWRFLAEMPVEVTDHRLWIRSLAGLYLWDGASPPAPRSSEMLYRSWRGMLRRAGELKPTQTTEYDLVEATTRRQREAFRRFETGTHGTEPLLTNEPVWPDQSVAAARLCLDQYLLQFPALCLADGPAVAPWRDATRPWFTGTRAPREIGREFHDTWFRPVPAGQFWMGDATSGYNDEPQFAAELKQPSRLAQFPVTNELLALYAPRHTESFAAYQDYSASPRCPAIYVNWYDAWCVATWLHARLPTEQEWEGACRAQFWSANSTPPQPTKYWFGDQERDLDRHAWHATNSQGRTHEVGAKQHANPLGLSDMHGQVWEWTMSWYATDPRANMDQAYISVSRVLRGGAFRSGADICRSAFRYHGAPASTINYDGVRLARAE
jgi:formylglycine-generating enzyme required for sulfatase activity